MIDDDNSFTARFESKTRVAAPSSTTSYNESNNMLLNTNSVNFSASASVFQPQSNAMSLNPSSSCFVPSNHLATKQAGLPASNSGECADSANGTQKQQSRRMNAANKEKYHAGSSRWGKYKK